MDSAGLCYTSHTHKHTHTLREKQGRAANIRKWQRPITAQLSLLSLQSVCHQSISGRCAAQTHRQAATERRTLSRHCFLWECTFHFICAVFPLPEIAVSVTAWLKAYEKLLSWAILVPWMKSSRNSKQMQCIVIVQVHSLSKHVLHIQKCAIHLT